MDLEAGKRRAWSLARLVIAWFLTAIGIVLLVLPGPGILFLIPGLTLLSAESRWFRRFLRRMRERHVVRRAMREAERAGIRFDLGPDEDGSGDGPPTGGAAPR